MKKVNVLYIVLTAAMTVGFILLGVFIFGSSYLRLIETVKDMCSSVIFYVSTLFYIPSDVVPTVNNYSEIFSFGGYLPDSPEKVREFFGTFFRLFTDKENFMLWASGVFKGIGVIIEVFTVALPVILHFHALMHIPREQLEGKFEEKHEYDFKSRDMKITNSHIFFEKKFGRNDFKEIPNVRLMGEALAYLMKYLEKTGEKVVYSRGLSQYLISDILDEDVVCTIGQEEKKLLLFDDF